MKHCPNCGLPLAECVTFQSILPENYHPPALHWFDNPKPSETPPETPKSFSFSVDDIEVLNEALKTLHAETYRQELADKAFILRKKLLEK